MSVYRLSIFCVFTVLLALGGCGRDTQMRYTVRGEKGHCVLDLGDNISIEFLDVDWGTQKHRGTITTGGPSVANGQLKVGSNVVRRHYRSGVAEISVNSHLIRIEDGGEAVYLNGERLKISADETSKFEVGKAQTKTTPGP